MPRISVVLPTYDRASTLPQAIDSVVHQAFNDWELVIVDDGSTDDTALVCGRYKRILGERLTCIHQQNSGAAAARNLGLLVARGTHVAFLDSDDLFFPEKLSVMVEMLDSFSESDLVYSNYVTFSDGGETSAPVIVDNPLVPDPYPALLTVRGNVIVTPAVVARRDALLSCGGFDSTLPLCEDIDLWRRVARRGRIRYVSAPLVAVRLRPREDFPFALGIEARERLYLKALFEDPRLTPTFAGQLFADLFTAYAEVAQRRDMPRYAAELRAAAALVRRADATSSDTPTLLTMLAAAARQSAMQAQETGPARPTRSATPRAASNMPLRYADDASPGPARVETGTVAGGEDERDLRPAIEVSSPTPTVTVVTATYNRADLLRETIDSILGQTYRRVEYIVVDDGSTDGTGELVQRLGGRVRYLHHPNSGEAHSVNRGWHLASGDLFAVVSSDDPMPRRWLEECVSFMAARPELVVGYPDWQVIDDRSRPIYDVTVPEYDYDQMVGWSHCLPGPGALIRRALCQGVQTLRNPDFIYVSDLEAWFRLGLLGPFSRIPGVHAAWRQHSSAATVAVKDLRRAREHVALIDHFFAMPGLPRRIRQLERSARARAYYLAAQVVADSMPGRSLYYFLRSILVSPSEPRELPGYLHRSNMKRWGPLYARFVAGRTTP